MRAKKQTFRMSGLRIFFGGLLGKADVNVFSSFFSFKFQIKMSLAIFLILPHQGSGACTCECAGGWEGVREHMYGCG